MYLMLYLSGLLAVMTALVGVFSRSLHHRFAQDELPWAWSAFWFAGSLYHMAGAAGYGATDGAAMASWLQWSAAMLTLDSPGLRPGNATGDASA
jgi:hypothetical protein